jgi:hypothetical protein
MKIRIRKTKDIIAKMTELETPHPKTGKNQIDSKFYNDLKKEVEKRNVNQ